MKTDDLIRHQHRLFAAEACARYLRRALLAARSARIPRTTDRIRRAIKSADGAVRNRRSQLAGLQGN